MPDSPATYPRPRASRSHAARVVQGARWRLPLRGATLTVLCIALAACSDVASQPGGLTVDVTGLPAGVDAAVAVHDEADEALAMSASGDVAGATPGAYKVFADPVTAEEVTFEPEPAEQRVRVEPGAPATARVAYTQVGSDGSAKGDTAGAQGVTQGDTLQGVLWVDRDGDGRFSRGDTVLADAAVYLDLDGNGRRDDGDPTARTDAAGQYRFDGLTPDTAFEVRHERASSEAGQLRPASRRAAQQHVSHHVWFGAVPSPEGSTQ